MCTIFFSSSHNLNFLSLHFLSFSSLSPSSIHPQLTHSKIPRHIFLLYTRLHFFTLSNLPSLSAHLLQASHPLLPPLHTQVFIAPDPASFSLFLAFPTPPPGPCIAGFRCSDGQSSSLNTETCKLPKPTPGPSWKPPSPAVYGPEAMAVALPAGSSIPFSNTTISFSFSITGFIISDVNAVHFSRRSVPLFCFGFKAEGRRLRLHLLWISFASVINKRNISHTRELCSLVMDFDALYILQFTVRGHAVFFFFRPVFIFMVKNTNQSPWPRYVQVHTTNSLRHSRLMFLIIIFPCTQ